jgi:long-chain acyl-CoA synthetase
MTRSFLERLVASCSERSERTAMRVVGDDSQVYTFAEMLRQIRSVAFRLDGEAVEFGDRVALIGENHPCWAIAYLSILYRGAVCVPLDPHGDLDALTNFVENSEAKLAFIGSELRDKFQQIEERLGRRIPAVVWGDIDSSPQNGFRRFDDWAGTSTPISFDQERPSAAGDDIALLIYTSGTTGTPKGVPLTHGNIVAELDGINEVLKLADTEKILSLLPLFHAYLQIVNLWVASTYGCEVGYLKELSPNELGEAMKSFKPTILTTVPRLWYLFHKKIFDAVAAKPKTVQTIFRSMLATNGFARDTFGVNLGPKLFGQVHESFGGRLRLAVSAGSRFDEEVARDFHKLGFTILQGYGLTETSGAVTATYETDNRVGSVGKPMLGSELKIDNPDKDGIGEVLMRGGMVFSGYYRNPQATADAFTHDGWFRSGDLGRFDKDGHLYIVGRAKDVIVLPSGKNVHPEDVETHYLKSPLVEELAVIGIHDHKGSHAGAEKLAAVIVPDFEYLKQAKIANSREAIRYAFDNLGRELPEYQRVRDYIIRAEPLPRTATRKIKRFELKKETESGQIDGSGHGRTAKPWELSAADVTLLESPVGNTVRAVVRQNAKDATLVHPAMNLEIDLGLDSLARAETFAALEAAFAVNFDADEIARALTVADAIALVSSHRELSNGHSADSSLASGTSPASDITAGWTTIVRSVPNDLPEIQPILTDRPIFSAFAWSVYRCFNLFCRVFMRLEVEGLENITGLRAKGNNNSEGSTRGPAFLVCPNHQSFLDPFVLCSNYPLGIFRDTFHVGASEFFENPLMGWLARLLNVIPVNPDTELMRAMRAGAAGLKNGKILNIYPEGERAYDGKLHDFKKGAAILATELDLPIVPVALDGLHKVWPRRTWRIRPAKVKIKIGKPFYSSEIRQTAESFADGDQYAAVTAHLKKAIASMTEQMRSPTKR